MSSKTVDINDTETSLSELVALALKGDEVVIAEDNKPLARLVPVVSESKLSRIPGLNRGEIWMGDDFNEPLPESFWTGTE